MKHRKHEGHMSSNDARIAVLENTIGHIHEALERIDKRFDKIDQRFDAMDRKFEKIDQKFEAIDKKFDSLHQEMKQDFKDVNNRIWTLFFWMIGGFVGMFGMMAHALHWF